MKPLTCEQLAAVDERILACDILGALIAIREACRCGLNDAKEIHWERYQWLRAQGIAKFACSHNEYWAGVYG